MASNYQSFLAVGLLSGLISLSAACYFSDCPNAFTWSKRDALFNTFVRKNDVDAVRRLFQEKLMNCGLELPEETRYQSHCQLSEVKICCTADKHSSLTCEVVGDGGVVVERLGAQFEQGLRDELVVQQRGWPGDLCVDVEECCVAGDYCTTNLRCAKPNKFGISQLRHSSLLSRLLNNVNQP